jgi:benzodiazapine receptor
MFTAGVGTATWYATVARPSWMPEGRVIAAVWTGLFGLIAIASALVWRMSLDVRFTSLLAINLVLNVLWWWLFFGRRSPPAALVLLVPLETTCVALVFLAGTVSLPAGLLLAPYAAWMAFAGALNAAIVRLNRRRRPGGAR